MEFREKFVAFVDVLGFTNLVERAEQGADVTLSTIEAALADLGSEGDKTEIAKSGPTICPEAERQSPDVDFQLTQVSNCVIVSTEVSPAGAITITSHCWTAVLKLLRRGFMCRGHIRRGNIAHDGARFIGTGYQEAAAREKVVSVFSRDQNDTGTPFIEIDSAVTDYVDKCADECVREVFVRLTYRNDTVCAVFPFNRLSTSFVIVPDFNGEKEKRNNDVVRGWIHAMKQAIDDNTNMDDPMAVRKAEHYKAALDNQLEECERTDEMIDMLESPFPQGRM